MNLRRCEGLIPHRSRINLFAKLLLEIRMARFFPLLAREEFFNTLRRQSGMFAKIEGVVSGSVTRNLLVSEDGCNFNHTFV